jgi:UDP-3-O-[3-hydroxymyristoyl] glucosamine N-acyltransferase
MTIKLADLAVRYGCTLRGDPDAQVDHVGTLVDAGEGALSFLANPGYRKFLEQTGATAVVLTEEHADGAPCNSLITDNPYAVYAHIAQELHPLKPLSPGLHASVVTGVDCSIPGSCELAAGVVLGDRVSLGEGVYIGPNSVVGDNVVIGAHSRINANVTLYCGVELGERCCIHSGVVIGADGFGIAQSATGWVKVPQVGRVVVGDDVDIGAGTMIDRGAIEDTRLGNDVKVDNLVQIAHNVVIGDHTAIAGQTGIAGSATIGARCMLGGGVAVSGHITIADDVVLTGRAGVANSVKESGIYSGAIPAEEAGRWRRIAARIKNLDDLAKRLIKLERQFKDKDDGA